VVDAQVRVTILISISILVVAVLAVGPYANFEQRVNADDNNPNNNKYCDNHHSRNENCSHKDSTPFLLPFP
jgi:hypothetical protein